MEQLVQLCDFKLEWVYNDELKTAKQQLVRREGQVPVVFAFTRRQLSRSLKRSAKTSCVAVLSHDGAGELFQELLRVADAARRDWHALTAAYPADRDRCRRLIPMHLKGHTKPIFMDELQLHALHWKMDDA